MKPLKVSPHALTSMKAERDAYQNVANRYKAGTIARWQADERVKQLDAQIGRIQDSIDPVERPPQKPFLPICAACGQISDGNVYDNPCPACGQTLPVVVPSKTLHVKKEKVA